MAEKIRIEVEAQFTEKGLDNVVQKAAQAEKAMNDLKKTTETVGKSSGSSKPFDNMEKSASKAEQAIKKTKTAADKLGKTKADITLKVKDKATAAVDRVMSKLKPLAGGKVYNALLSAKDRASDTISNALALAKRLGSGAWSAVINAKDNASQHISSITSGLKKLVGGTWKVVINAKDNVSGLIRGITNKIFSLKTLIAGVMGGMAVKQFALQPIAFADQMENSYIGYKTMLGSAGAATNMMNEIKSFARTTPLDTTGVISSVQQMINSGIGDLEKLNADGTENENYVMKAIEKIGNAAMATGGGTEGLKGITTALSQMSMTGRVNAQDMMQLANRGIPAWKMLAEYFNTSVTAVRKMSEDGEISAEEGLAALMKGFERYNGMMNMLSTRTASGIWSNIKDTFQLSIVEKWGRGLQSGAIDGLRGFADWLDKISPKLDQAGASLEKIGEYISTKFFNGVEGIYTRVEEILDEDGFINADGIGAKLKYFFGELWKSAKDWLKEKAPDFGDFLGEALGKGITGIANFITGALGGDTSEIDGAAAGIGESFWDAFCASFDGEKVWTAVKRALKTVFSSAAKLLPGGAAPDLGSIISAYMIYKTLGGSTLLGGAKLAGKGLKWGVGKGVGALASTLGTSTAIAGSLVTGGALAAGGLISSGRSFVNAYNEYERGNRVEGFANVLEGTGTIAGTGLGAALGAKWGATAGTALGGPIGTVAGGVLGAGIGAVAGWGAGKIAAYNYRKEKGFVEETDAISEFGKRYGITEAAAANTYATKTMQKAIKDTTKSADELGKAFEYAVSNRMKEKFGDITFSLEEIDSLAKQITFGDNAEAFETFTAAVLEAEQAVADFASSKTSLAKWRLKTNLGLDVKGEENVGQFKADVENFITNAKNVVEKNQLEAVAAVDVLLDVSEGSAGEGISKSVGLFYEDLKKQIEEVSTTYTNEKGEKIKITMDNLATLTGDNVITIDEQKAINDLTNQVNEIVKKVTTAKQEAELEAIQLKFPQMTSDNYEDLLSSLSEYIDSGVQTAQDAYVSSATPIKVQMNDLKLQLEAGEITQEEYNTALAPLQEQLNTLKEGFYLEIGEIKAQTTNLAIEIASGSYADMFGGSAEKAAEAMKNALEQALNNKALGDPINWTTAQVQAQLGVENLSVEDTEILRRTLSLIFNNSNKTEVTVPVTATPEVTVNQPETAPVVKIPDTTANVNVTPVPSLSLWNYKTYNNLFPPINTSTTADVSVDSTYDINDPTFGPYSGSATANVSLRANYTLTNQPTFSSNGGKVVVGSYEVESYNGRIAERPMVSTLAEEGWPEAVIPFNPARRQRALELYEETGRRLGVMQNANGGIIGDNENPYNPPSSDFNISNVSSGSGGQISVKMEKGSVQISIVADSSQTVSEAIEDQKEEIAEKISGIISKALGAQFANMPVKVSL